MSEPQQKTPSGALTPPASCFPMALAVLLLLMETRVAKGLDDDGRAGVRKVVSLIDDFTETASALGLDASTMEAFAETRAYLTRAAPLLSKLV